MLFGCLTCMTRASEVLFFQGFEESTPQVAGAVIIEVCNDPHQGTGEKQHTLDQLCASCERRTGCTVAVGARTASAMRHR